MKTIYILDKEDINTSVYGKNFVIASNNGVKVILTREALEELVKDGGKLLPPDEGEGEGETVSYRSVAVWPPDEDNSDLNETHHLHDTYSQALYKCNMSTRFGFDGRRKVFPVSVRVEVVHG